MKSVEWGNVADWVSGIGSLLAIVFVIIQMNREKKIHKEKEQNEIFNSLEVKSSEIQGLINNYRNKIIQNPTFDVKTETLSILTTNLFNVIIDISGLTINIDNKSLGYDITKETEKLSENILKLEKHNLLTGDDKDMYDILKSIEWNSKEIKRYIFECKLKDRESYF